MAKKERAMLAISAEPKSKKLYGIKLFDVVPLEPPKPKKPGKLAGRTKQKEAFTVAAIASIEEVQVFSASAKVFGKKSVHADSIVKIAQEDITLSLAENNFKFDQLFKDFTSAANNLFVFDEVSIHLREKQENGATVQVMRFNGKLRMDKKPLSTLKSFLKTDSGLLVAGKIETNVKDITEKIPPCKVSLSSAATFLLPLADGIILKSAALNVELSQVGGQWTFIESISGKLEINRFGTTPVELNATVTHSAGKLNVVAKLSKITGLFGIDNLVLDNFLIGFNVGSENDIALSADFKPGNKKFSFSGKIASGFTGIKASSPKFSFNDFNSLFQYFNNDTLALPEFDITFSDAFIGFATADGTLGTEKLKQGLTIGGAVKIQGLTITALAQISNDGVMFKGVTGDLDFGPVHITQTALDMKFFSAASGRKSEFALMGKTVIEGLGLDCKVAWEKDNKGKTNQLVYAAIQAESFGLASIFPPAKNTFVDSLKFSKVAFIYSSADSNTQDGDFQFSVKKGLQLSAILEEVPALTALTHSKKTGLVLSAYFGTTTGISIEMPDTRLQLGESVTCAPMRIGIELLPQPALQLIFGLDVIVPKQIDPLHFDLMLEIGVTEARGSATMKGYWVNPFGVTGLQIGPELALQLGIIYAQFAATGLPSEFGFAGGIVLGEVSGKMAVNVSANPMNQVLMGEVEKLNPQNLVAFASNLTGLSFNQADIPDFFDLEQLKLYCAPAGGSIGTITFEPGFSFAANLVMFKKRIKIYTLFNETGVIAKGELDKLEIGPLKIKGSKGGNARLDLELTAEKQAVLIDGAFEFFGTGQSIFLDISKNGASFEFEQKFLNMLRYKIRAQTKGSFNNLSSIDFLLYGEFENELTTYIKTKLVDKINDARRAATVSLEDAQKKVETARKAYVAEFNAAKQKLDKAQLAADAYLAKCTKEVNDQRAVWEAKIKAAQSEVTKAKETYDKALNDARNKVAQAERDYNSAMLDAQNKVRDAQNAYNAEFNKAKADADKAITDYNNSFGKAYRDLDSAQNTVNSLQREINSLQNKIDNLAWYEKAAAIYYGSQLAAVWVSMKTAQGVLAACKAIVNGFQKSSVVIARNTAQATLEAVQKTGTAAIRSANLTLEGVRYGAGFVAFQSAQQTLNGLQYGAQYTTWQVAAGTLAAAQTTGRNLLTAAEYSLNNIGTSVVYVSLQSAQVGLELVKKGTSAVAFETAKGVLEGAKLGTEGVLVLSAYLASHVGDLIDVRKITLAASLKEIAKGKFFIATFDGSVLNKPYICTIDFNVTDATAFIENLFKNVFEEAKSIASVA